MRVGDQVRESALYLPGHEAEAVTELVYRFAAVAQVHDITLPVFHFDTVPDPDYGTLVMWWEAYAL